MGGAAHGGPVALPMADETACRRAYANLLAEKLQRRVRMVLEQRGEGTGPEYGYALCVNGADGQVIALDRR